MLSFSFFVFFFYYLQTPKTEEEWQTIAASFQQRWQFPHCLGALDGKHIFIQPPAHSGSTFHNYKGRFSILMMAVVRGAVKGGKVRMILRAHDGRGPPEGET